MTRFALLAACAVCLSFLSAGCTGAVRVTVRAKVTPVKIGTNPAKLPAPPVAKAPAKPADGAMWVAGHYEWTAGAARYMWVEGRWEMPRADQVWFPGHYAWARVANVRVRKWVPGHWEKKDGVEPAGAPAEVAQGGGTTPAPAPAPAPDGKPLPAHVESVEPPEGVGARRPATPEGHVFWIEGHWAWNSDAHKYEWSAGRWETASRDTRWVAGAYTQARVKSVMVKLWDEGYWEPVDKGAARPEISKVKVRHPPEEAGARRPAIPGRGYFWIDGHYAFDRKANDYVWHDGRWERQRRNLTWASGRARWVLVSGELVQVWVAGYWERADDEGEAAGR